MTCAPPRCRRSAASGRNRPSTSKSPRRFCYHGSSACNERRWAEEHGWTAREFTVTEAAATALVDRGVPFTFNTVDLGGGHLQAVIGYDGRRGTLWIRDPFWRNAQEAIADKILEQYQAWGPRGMAMVPAEQRQRLDGLELPDAALWDRLHAMDLALERHCREEAAAICEDLAAAGDGSRLNWEARLRLACYDVNASERLAAVVELQKRFPDDRCLQLERLTCLRDLARARSDWRFTRSCARRGRPTPSSCSNTPRNSAATRGAAAKRSDCCGGQFAGARGRRQLLHPRPRPLEPTQIRRGDGLVSFRRLHERQGGGFRQRVLRRRAVVQADRRGAGFPSRPLRAVRQEVGISARTLVNAYMQCDRSGEALAVLEEAMRLRPEDGPLRLFAADAGWPRAARRTCPAPPTLLAEAKGVSPRGDWLRMAARLADRQGRRDEALASRRELLEIQPLASDALRARAQLLAETQGTAAAPGAFSPGGRPLPASPTPAPPLAGMGARRAGGSPRGGAAAGGGGQPPRRLGPARVGVLPSRRAANGGSPARGGGCRQFGPGQPAAAVPSRGCCATRGRSTQRKRPCARRFACRWTTIRRSRP